MSRCCRWRAGLASAANDGFGGWYPVLAGTTERSVYDGWRTWTCSVSAGIASFGTLCDIMGISTMY